MSEKKENTELSTAAATGVAGVEDAKQSAGAGDLDPKAPENVQSETATVSRLEIVPDSSNRSDPTVPDSEGMDVDE